MEKAFLAALQATEKLGAVKIKGLIHHFGSAREAWQADRRALFFSGCLCETEVDQLAAARKRLDPLAAYAQWEKSGIRLVALGEDEYPDLLRQIFDPPFLLYVRGCVPREGLPIAVVGSRQATPYGKQAAEWLAGELARQDCLIVSGAARGIDTAAHKGALAAPQGRTIAVLGCGVDVNYPPENRQLLQKIAAAGAVISEYPPGTPPLPYRFPARNRIINGLSQGVLLVEAAERSGAMITADYALAEGRDVFCVPGNIFSPTSAGVNGLIQQGAKLVCRAGDILQEYGLSVAENAGVDEPSPLTGPEKQVWAALDREEPSGVEELVHKTGLGAAEVFTALSLLELSGRILRCGGQRFLRGVTEEGQQ